MPRRASSGAFLALAALVAAPAAAAEDEPTADSVTLDFRWPEGLTAQVEASVGRRDSDGADVSEISIQGTYRLRTRKDARGLALVAEEPRVTNLNGRAVPLDAGPAADEIALTLQAVSLFPPTRIVNAEAEIVAVEGAQDAMSLLERPGAAGGDPAAQALLQELAAEKLSAQASAAAAQEFWLLSVYYWDDAELEIGAEYELDDAGEVEVGPGIVAGLSMQLSARERVPCRAGASEARCVRLEASVAIEPEAHRRGLEARMRQIAKRLGGEGIELPPEDVIRSVSGVKHVELIVEPATLLPHRVRVREHETLESVDGRSREKIIQRERRYTYPPG